MFRLLGTAIYYAAAPVAKATLGVAGAAIKGTASAIGGTIEGISFAAELQRRSDWDNVTNCGQYPQVWDEYERNGYESAIKLTEKLKAAEQAEEKAQHPTSFQIISRNSELIHLDCPSAPKTIIQKHTPIIPTAEIERTKTDTKLQQISLGLTTDEKEIALVATAQLEADKLSILELYEAIKSKVEESIEAKFSSAPLSQESHDVVNNIVSYTHRMVDVVLRYHKDHNATSEQAERIAKGFQELASLLSSLNTVYELEIVYSAITTFCHELDKFRHSSPKRWWAKDVQRNVLDPLRDYIAKQKQ